MKSWCHILLLMSALAGPAAALTENFDGLPGPGLPAGWKSTNSGWAVKGDALWYKGSTGAQVVTIERAGSEAGVTVEATVLVRRHEGNNWLVAGVTVRQDEKNFWHCALVEAPPDKKGTHYMELLQCLDGHRNAQSEGTNKLVRVTRQGDLYAWEFNHPYRLRIALRGDQVEGTLTELDGTVRAQTIYQLKDPCVRRGTPGLSASNATAVFDDIRVDR